MIPRKATGSHPLIQTVNALIDAVEERTLIQGTGVLLKKTLKGVIVTATAKNSGGSGGGSSGDGGDPRWA
jgi:hypothetical protein